MRTDMKPLDSGKMFQHLDRLASWQTGEMPAPVTVELDLTNSCNHACPGCTFSYLVNKDGSSLPYHLAANTINELAAIGVKAITFSGGGEPLVYGVDRVLKLMDWTRTLGPEVSLITNGSKLREKEFLDHCTWIRVSLDAYDENTFQRFHGRNLKEFNRVVESIQTMISYGVEGCTLGVGFLTDQESSGRGDVIRMTKFCLEKLPGLHYLQFRPLVVNMVDAPDLQGGWKNPSQGDDTCGHSGELLAMSRAIDLARSVAGDRLQVIWSEDKYTALSKPDFERTYTRCHAHFLQATIGADGGVYVCCHGQGQDAYRLGTLHEETFQEIWYGDRARSVLAAIDPSKKCPPACRLHSQNRTLHQILQPVQHRNYI